MLCTMCTHGVTTAVDGKPTGQVWQCRCGERSCRHIAACDKCGTAKSRNRILTVVLALEVYFDQYEITPEALAETLDEAMQRGLTDEDRKRLGQPHVNKIHVPEVTAAPT